MGPTEFLYDATRDFTPASSYSPECSLADLGREITTKESVWDSFEPYVQDLPPRQADVMFLLYKAGLKQDKVGLLLQMTQAAISYRKRRAEKQIKFLRVRGRVCLHCLQENPPGKFSPNEINMLWTFLSTCSMIRARDVKHVVKFPRRDYGHPPTKERLDDIRSRCRDPEIIRQYDLCREHPLMLSEMFFHFLQAHLKLLRAEIEAPAHREPYPEVASASF